MPRKDGPALSCFAAPLASRTAQAWIDCISAELSALAAVADTNRIRNLMERFRAAHVFDSAERPSRVHPALAETSAATRVLLIDEPATVDLEPHRAARQKQFVRMVAQARSANSTAEFWLARTNTQHSGAWLASGCVDLLGPLRHIDEHSSLCASIANFDHVYTLGAAEGMQALLSGVPLHVFGTPYYAGWGLTHDYVPQPAGQSYTTLDLLFEVAFVRLSHHIGQDARTPESLEALLDAIEAHRTTVLRFADIKCAAGVRFQWWKRPFATPYLSAGGGTLRWIDGAHKLREGEYAAFWGARSAEGLPADAPAIRIEDGFLHSTGLGSDHIAPCSQIIDRRGLYFDPSRPSDLTVILNETAFSDADLARARALRGEIARLGLTKYNLGRRKPAWHAPAGKRVMLVPGQVADDASIRLGTRGVTTAEQLLREVRAQRPDAFIVYKPHPDVLSGNRQGLIEAAALADVVEQDADLISLIEVADEVHTLSSLSGFEALIRGKAVYTYGLPFYAGWGLTTDALAQPWRKRALSLDMLTAGALLHYPVYWNWSLRLFTTPEVIVRQLAAAAARPLEKIRGNRLRPLLKAFRWSRNVLWHLAWHYGSQRDRGPSWHAVTATDRCDAAFAPGNSTSDEKMRNE
ncbi:capsular biosynthesis protein [Paraburkholderia pallida]|uniref:Capsular biosynthesis protein n=1 Tax=Paraburkholderia pallida TaxID=2547399 RepID=A0A4P7CW50_9BURK|nr:capsular biosynthesis protein [Paraburkholderia pallida]QBQ98344.1 capsular biosynthesis protein [Paraburkholderia pallida]